MFKQFLQKCVKLSSKLNGMLLLAALLSVCSVPATAIAEDGIPAASDDKTASCKGLKPFKDMDELVYQIYTNLDSDCLFKMNPKELAEIWRIPSREYRGWHKKGIEWERKPAAEGDHGHLLIQFFNSDEDPYTDLFTIALDYDKNSRDYPFFPNFEYPSGLPAEPLIRKLGGHPTSHIMEAECTRGKYKESTMYIWFNSDKTRMLYLRSGCRSVELITVQDFVHISLEKGSD